MGVSCPPCVAKAVDALAISRGSCAHAMRRGRALKYAATGDAYTTNVYSGAGASPRMGPVPMSSGRIYSEPCDAAREVRATRAHAHGAAPHLALGRDVVLVGHHNLLHRLNEHVCTACGA